MKTGMIYQIVYKNDESINYIGSSMNNEVKYRWRDHKADYKKYLEQPNNKRAVIYDYFKQYGIENFIIKKLKDIQVEDRDHLMAYEQLYINKFKPVNKLNPFNILFKEDRKNYQKQHYIKNKDKKLVYCKERYKNNKEYFTNYASANKDRIKEYKKEYYQKDRENYPDKYKQREEKQKEKILCKICNTYIARGHFKDHERTQIHKDKENNIDYSKDPNKKLCNICNTYVSKKHFKEHERSLKHQNNLNNNN
jgi:hypothetical protein